jgi:hypothetical protein
MSADELRDIEDRPFDIREFYYVRPRQQSQRRLLVS